KAPAPDAAVVQAPCPLKAAAEAATEVAEDCPAPTSTTRPPAPSAPNPPSPPASAPPESRAAPPTGSTSSSAPGVEPQATPSRAPAVPVVPVAVRFNSSPDRKSTRLNSSHVKISYAVFCLKKKKRLSG